MDNTTPARPTLVCGSCGRPRTSPDCDLRKHWGYGIDTTPRATRRDAPHYDSITAAAALAQPPCAGYA